MSAPLENVREMQPQLPLLSRLSLGSQAYGMVAFMRSASWARGWHQYVYPTQFDPDLWKTYKTRPNLSVRVFYPPGRTVSPSANLPTLFTLHGGGFTIGSPADDDKWNRTFADLNNVLVIALDYSKAPSHPFPTAIYDAEALVLAILADASLPVDKRRCAIAGFSAGGNLALAVSQLEAVKTGFSSYGGLGFTAVIPVYAGVDRTNTREHRATQRQYKPELTPNRNSTADYLLKMGKVFDWSYVPAGQSLRDPLISPIFASRQSLPRHIFFVACELDMSSHDTWRMACRLAGRPEPARDRKSGRAECGEVGELELEDERFAWTDDKRGVRWLLVPDVVHAFDRLPPFMLGDATTVRDAEAKTIKVIQEIGGWLKGTVWT